MWARDETQQQSAFLAQTGHMLEQKAGKQPQALCLNSYCPSMGEAEGVLSGSRGRLDLHSEIEATQGYMARPSQKNKTKTKQTQKSPIFKFILQGNTRVCYLILENNGMLILGPFVTQHCPILYQSVSMAQQVLEKNSYEDFVAFS